MNKLRLILVFIPCLFLVVIVGMSKALDGFLEGVNEAFDVMWDSYEAEFSKPAKTEVETPDFWNHK